MPTAPATRADGKAENQKQVFRFPTAPRIDWERINKKPRRAAFALCPPKHPNHHERRLLPATWTTPFSGSCRIGIEESFQAHLPLESILDFRLICGLENATAPQSSASRAGVSWPQSVGRKTIARRVSAGNGERAVSPGTGRKNFLAAAPCAWLAAPPPLCGAGNPVRSRLRPASRPPRMPVPLGPA